MGLLDFLYPKKCVNCGKFGEYLCPNCFSKIKYNDNFICPICGRPSLTFWKHSKCQNQYDLDGILTITVYNKVAKKLIYRLKYQPNLTNLAAIISDIMIEHLIQNETFYRFLEKEKPVIMPIPLGKKSLKERGYNQAELLASYVAQYFKLKIIKRGLIRIKQTKSQNNFTLLQRIKNVENAFEINRNFKIPKSIILIDDTVSSMATLKETAKVLKKNGTKIVVGLTFAHEI